MRAVETVYKDYCFRSRLEARWAVFFDVLRIHWLYEPEGFVCDDGTWYLPDFYLPSFNGGIFVEVKPLDGDISKPRSLVASCGTPLLVCEDVPELREYRLIMLDDEDSGEVCEVPAAFHEKHFKGGRNYPEHRLYVWPGSPDEYGGTPVMRAIAAARGARFEHGESPA